MKKKSIAWIVLIFCGVFTFSLFAIPEKPKQEVAQPDEEIVGADFLILLNGEPRDRSAAFDRILRDWEPGHAAMAIESVRFLRSRDAAFLYRILEKKTGENWGSDWAAWSQWLWNQPVAEVSGYAEFKRILYSSIDPTFAGYFSRDRDKTIRLDEIVWGGVVQDGIPPLRQPEMITASEADYLKDDHVVFGLEVNGDARAYPKRILAWHEMFVDEVGGIPVAGVYCTLCGSMILYETTVDGVAHAMGTSGFLYRSNKLMYDQRTQSLWNTLEGEPVVGPLVGQGIVLPRRSVVTTTWGEWRKRHPDTTVLSTNTGHRRDYGEGVAYHQYFATDELMFPVPVVDSKLKNKAEVLGLLFPWNREKPLAIEADFLKENPIYSLRWVGKDILILTDSSGANRAFENDAKLTFEQGETEAELVDGEGRTWTISESQLTASDGSTLQRLPAHRAFWFGWRAAFPQTQLIQI